MESRSQLEPRVTAQPRPNVFENSRTKIAHTPTTVTRSGLPAIRQAITTPKANSTPTVMESGVLKNSPQCLHFFASARIFSAQKAHFRWLAAVMAVAVDDMVFLPLKPVLSWPV